MALSDEDFTKQFHAAPTLLRKIQLAIREERYSIWVRNPPNFPDEYLKPIATLPESTKVTQKPRQSGGPGLGYVVELKYMYREMGKPVPIYLKGYFAQDGRLIVGFDIQSLKDDSEDR